MLSQMPFVRRKLKKQELLNSFVSRCIIFKAPWRGETAAAASVSHFHDFMCQPVPCKTRNVIFSRSRPRCTAARLTLGRSKFFAGGVGVGGQRLVSHSCSPSLCRVTPSNPGGFSLRMTWPRHVQDSQAHPRAGNFDWIVCFISEK